jgi:hypothetical protein
MREIGTLRMQRVSAITIAALVIAPALTTPLQRRLIFGNAAFGMHNDATIIG